MDNIILTLSLILFLGFISQWLAWRIKIPAILLLLTTGILIGPVFDWFKPEELFGNLLHPGISLAVAIILFEGSLTLKFSEVKQVGGVVRKLISLGAFITWAIVALSMHYIFDLSLSLSILFGALMTVTGPTVVVPMLRTIRPNTNISNVLRWEGILIDPVGALLAVMVFEFIILQSQADIIEPLAWLFFKIIALGTLLGIISGWVLEQLLSRHWIPEYLQNVATLAVVLLTFSISNTLAHESGLLAVTLMGIWLANSKKVHIEDILNFKENLTVLLISLLFIILSSQIQLVQMLSIWWTALGAYLIVQFVARPLGVMFSTIKSDLSWKERVLIAWIGPRGIVAAAISGLFALKLQSVGYSGAELLVPLTFSVIIGTVLIQSLTAKFIGNSLGVTEPESNGYLIVGASELSQAIALELQKIGARVLLTDTSYSNIQDARMAGLKTFYGNPVSEYADQHLDLIGVGKLLAISPRKELNTIACLRYSSEFGRDNIYHIATTTDKATIKKHQAARELRGDTLFGKEITYRKLSGMLKSDFEVRTTLLTESFTYGDYQEKNPSACKLFYVKPSLEIGIFLEQSSNIIEPGYKIVALLPKQKVDI